MKLSMAARIRRAMSAFMERWILGSNLEIYRLMPKRKAFPNPASDIPDQVIVPSAPGNEESLSTEEESQELADLGEADLRETPQQLKAEESKHLNFERRKERGESPRHIGM